MENMENKENALTTLTAATTDSTDRTNDTNNSAYEFVCPETGVLFSMTAEEAEDEGITSYKDFINYLISTDEIIPVYGTDKHISSDCADSVRFTYTCPDCGKEITMSYEEANDSEIGDEDAFIQYLRDECEITTVQNGDDVCQDCLENDYSFCEDCEEYCHNDDMVYINNGYRDEGYVCQDCFDRGNYFHCDCCDESFSDNHLWASDGNRSICDRCSDDYVQCYDCGTIIACGYANYDEDRDEYYCDDCWQRNSGYHHLREYHDRPSLMFHPNIVPGNKLHEGIELETDDGNSREDYTDDLYDISEQETLFYMNTDGSLSNGVEIITQPCTMEYHLNSFPWEEIIETAHNYHFKSHDAGTCGLHVHVSRAGLGSNDDEIDLTIAKLIIMMDNLWDKMVKFARRTSTQLHWAQRTSVEVSDSDTETEAIRKSKDATGGDRYRAINLCNYNTVEFRIFRGSLKETTIKATLEFVNGFCEYAKAHSLTECLHTSWDSLLTEIVNKLEAVNADYNHLRIYLGERNLLPEGMIPYGDSSSNDSPLADSEDDVDVA